MSEKKDETKYLENHPIYHRQAVTNMVLAHRAIGLGDKKVAESHLSTARTYIKLNVDHLSKLGHSQQGLEYEQAALEHVKTAENVLRSPEYKGMKKSELIKGTPQLKGAAAAEKMQENSTGVASARKVTKPSQDPRYKYKPLHALSEMDQAKAHTTYGGKEMQHHEYPVDAKGSLVHGARAPLKSPRPDVGSYPELKPAFTPGTPVNIHQSSGVSHTFGMVRAPSPYHPGKVRVQVGAKEHQVAHVLPEHLSERKPTNTFEKALGALMDLRDRLGK